jgi:ligand-binding sensor domain-containing protein
VRQSATGFWLRYSFTGIRLHNDAASKHHADTGTFDAEVASVAVLPSLTQIPDSSKVDRLRTARNLVVALCWLSLCLPAFVVARQSSLDLGRWKNFTDMKAVRGVAATTDSVWTATAGGLFLYIPSANRFVKYTNSDGLSSNDLTAVTLDGAGRVWAGSSDGFVNGFNPSTGEWVEIRSIHESEQVAKTVRTLLVRGDSLFIGTDYGISVLQISRKEFRDTYANLGFATQAGVNDVKIYKNRIWAATDLGVASAQLDAPNLSAPTSWTQYTVMNGLPTNLSTSISNLHDSVVVGTTLGVVMFDGKKFSQAAAFVNRPVVDLLARANDVVVLLSDASSFRLESFTSLSAPSTVIAVNAQVQASSFAAQPQSTNLWAGTVSQGIARWTGSWEYKVPNGPMSNLFSSIVVDDQGVLWAASGISGRGRGFYRYDPSAPEDSRWRNYTVAGHPVMTSDDYYKVSLGSSGSVWVSSWGYGIVEVVGDSIRRRLDQTTTPALAGAVASNPNYVVVGGVAVDSKGSTWIVDRTAVNGYHLLQLKSDGTATPRTSISDGRLTNILIDRNDTKWFANAEPSDKPITGLYYFNEDSSVAGTRAFGGWGNMTTENGLASNTILSLALDLDGDVCVGTDLGMSIFIDPRSPLTSKAAYTPLRGQTIQAIAVDAVNNKWAGTKEGVNVLNSDGTQLLAQYSVLTTNGKLVGDDIRSIAFDQKRGIVYFGTEKGLSSLEVFPVQAARTMTSLDLGPNPFIIPSLAALTIRNLAAESSIKILSTNGALICEFKAQGGGRAFWDGRNRQGDLVSSGIYFVVAYAENGTQTSTGKIAVIRR